MALRNQFLASGLTPVIMEEQEVKTLCGICLCLGIMFAWPSSTVRLFASPDTPLHRPMTDTELALLGSLSSVGALVGTPLLALLLDTLGRRYTSVLFSLLNVVSWSVVCVCARVEAVLAAMLVSGVGGAAFLVVPVFVGEVCEEAVRGALTSGCMVMYAAGMMLSYALGGALPYYPMVYTSLGVCALVTAGLAFTKESPTHLLAKGREQDAARAIAFYRSVAVDSKVVQEELAVIRQSLNPHMDDAPEEETLKGGEKSTQKLSTWQFIKKSRSTRNGIYLNIILLTLSIFQGLVVLQVYAEPLMEQALPRVPSNRASILLALDAVLAGFVAAYLTERAGRRPLMIYSSIATGASCVLLGTQLQVQWGPPWVAAVGVYLFTAAFSFGAGTVPYVLMGEVFLPQVKSVLTMLVVEWAWLCNSVILFVFAPVLKAIGLGPVFYIFAGVSLLTSLYCYFWLPETRGLTVHQIQERLTANRSRTRGGRV